jgi:hypothetical protein
MQDYPFLRDSVDRSPIALIDAIIDGELPVLPDRYSEEAVEFARLW